MKVVYIFIKQHDATDCVAAGLIMVCLHYKKEVMITKLIEIMGTNLKWTNLFVLKKCTELGFTSQLVMVDKKEFFSYFILPCIADIITKEEHNHFFVIFKFTKTHCIVGDLAKELLRLKTDEFYKNFSGVLLILKPKQDFVSGNVKGEKTFNSFLKLLLPQKKLFIYSLIASITSFKLYWFWVNYLR